MSYECLYVLLPGLYKEQFGLEQGSPCLKKHNTSKSIPKVVINIGKVVSWENYSDSEVTTLDIKCEFGANKSLEKYIIKVFYVSRKI